MKALITGATGFIGSHLAEQLHAKGYELRALIRKTSNTKYIDHLPVEYVTGSLADKESLKAAVEGVDYIFHVAGVVASKDRAGFFRGNEEATRNILEAARQYNPHLKRFIHVSSLSAVGPAASPAEPVTEDVPFRPITTYGESKAAAEKVAFEYMEHLPVTIVRPPAVYGPRDVGVYTFFQVVARGFAPLIGFDRKKVSLVHVDDLVRGFIQAAESDRAEGEAYFISSDEFYEWSEVGNVAAQVFGHKKVRNLRVPHAIIFAVAGISGFFGKFQKKPPVLDFEKGRDITQPYWICSVDKARDHFGYCQQMNIEDGVRNTVEWYRTQKWIK